jgi:hypothetical protein
VSGCCSPLSAGVVSAAGELVQQFLWGTGAAPAVAAQRWLPRTNSNVNAGFYTSEYPMAFGGLLLFTVTWRVSFNMLTTNTVTLQLFQNGAGSTLSGPIPPNVRSGQFSGLLAVAAKDGISAGLLQSSNEAQANWMLDVSVMAVVPP